MGRTSIAIAAGFALWTILWLATNTILQNSFPRLYAPAGEPAAILLLVLLILSVVYSVVSGYVTAAVATQDRERHALYLGIALLLVGLFVQFQNWTLMPLWYHVLFLGLLIPGAMLGGYGSVLRNAPADPEHDVSEFHR